MFDDQSLLKCNLLFAFVTPKACVQDLRSTTMFAGNNSCRYVDACLELVRCKIRWNMVRHAVLKPFVGLSSPRLAIKIGVATLSPCCCRFASLAKPPAKEFCCISSTNLWNDLIKETRALHQLWFDLARKMSLLSCQIYCELWRATTHASL